jgi:hypothetical protein
MLRDRERAACASSLAHCAALDGSESWIRNRVREFTMLNAKDLVDEIEYQQPSPKVRPIRPELNYVAEIFSLEDPEFVTVRKQLRERQLEYMSLAPAEGRVLQFLIRGFRIRRIVEIGALYGYSCLCMAKALPSDGEIISLEKDPAR